MPSRVMWLIASTSFHSHDRIQLEQGDRGGRALEFVIGSPPPIVTGVCTE